MRWLEVRRHSLTKKGDARGSGSHLSQAGVALAQRVGAGLEGITRVVVSQSPRTSETALAMGFAVDEIVDMGSGYIAGEVSHHEQWTWADPFSRYAALVAEGRGLAAFATEGLALWRRTVEEISDGDAALIIGHGGSIEPCLVACFQHAEHTQWGGPFGHCDGARLCWNDTEFVSIEIHRAPRET